MPLVVGDVGRRASVGKRPHGNKGIVIFHIQFGKGDVSSVDRRDYGVDLLLGQFLFDDEFLLLLGLPLFVDLWSACRDLGRNCIQRSQHSLFVVVSVVNSI